MQRSKMSRIMTILLALVMSLMFLLPLELITVNAAEYDGSFYARAKSFSSVQLKWNQNTKIVKWKIYKKSGKGSYKLIKTLKGTTAKKSTGYKVTKLKKNVKYTFKVKGYLKNGTCKYLSMAEAYTGLRQPQWEDYINVFANYSPTAIQLTGYTDFDGIKPTGYKVYRRVDRPKADYKCIATVKKVDFNYTDKTVKAGTKYRYKIRSYKTLGGKNYYSPYTSSLPRSAIWKGGKYQITDLDTKDPDILGFAITADKYCGDLNFGRIFYIDGYGTEEDAEDPGPVAEMYMISSNGANYSVISPSDYKGTTIKGGQKLYLIVDCSQYSGSGYPILHQRVTYNGEYYLMDISPANQTLTLEMDDDYCH